MFTLSLASSLTHLFLILPAQFIPTLLFSCHPPLLLSSHPSLLTLLFSSYPSPLTFLLFSSLVALPLLHYHHHPTFGPSYIPPLLFLIPPFPTLPFRHSPSLIISPSSLFLPSLLFPSPFTTCIPGSVSSTALLSDLRWSKGQSIARVAIHDLSAGKRNERKKRIKHTDAASVILSSILCLLPFPFIPLFL